MLTGTYSQRHFRAATQIAAVRHLQPIPGDQESGNDEEDIHADEAAPRPTQQVERQYGEDCDHPEALDVQAPTG